MKELLSPVVYTGNASSLLTGQSVGISQYARQSLLYFSKCFLPFKIFKRREWWQCFYTTWKWIPIFHFLHSYPNTVPTAGYSVSLISILSTPQANSPLSGNSSVWHFWKDPFLDKQIIMTWFTYVLNITIFCLKSCWVLHKPPCYQNYNLYPYIQQHDALMFSLDATCAQI